MCKFAVYTLLWYSDIIKYEYVIENNEIKYKSNTFNVEKLVSGNFGDNDDVKYKDNVGKIFGTENDNEGHYRPRCV